MKPLDWLRAKAADVVRINDARPREAAPTTARTMPKTVDEVSFANVTIQVNHALTEAAIELAPLQAAPATRARHRDVPWCTCDLVVYSRYYPSSHGRYP